ncbi:hypothetical protein WMY93_012194 [Mugilogobius chulae]|uniref:Uncharacterized protein n=1 Tax=Mugilogobius chulae TaxID=88201 RepID=A0AAW0PGW8_9GOBI
MEGEKSAEPKEVKEGETPEVEVEGEEAPVKGKRKKKRTGPLVPETVVEVGVYFTCGLSDVTAIVGTDAELVCRLNTEDCDGVWYKEGQEITATDDLCIVKDGTYRKLIVKNCKEEDAGKFKYEADGRKTEALLKVEDPPRINAEELEEYKKPVAIKTGKGASFKVSFVGREPMKIQWFNEGEELIEDSHTKIEKSDTHTCLVLTKCTRKISGEIKVKIKNECGVTEAITSFLYKPTQPLGPVDIIESCSTLIEFKWRPPKDNGGSPITDYILERQQIGRNSWKKQDVDHGRKYCYHIRAETDQGVSDMMETDDIQAGTKDCINLAWNAPSNTGGTDIFGYNVEKRKNGSNRWDQVNPQNELIRESMCEGCCRGFEYEFRVSAVNISGAGEPSTPQKPPGKVIDLKVTDSTYTTLSLGWTKPIEDEVSKTKLKCSHCNSHYHGSQSMAMYWVRVVATNEGGDGEPQELDNYIIAMPPPVRPQFTDRKIKNFMVMKAGNSVRVNYNLCNSDTSSQLIIASAERHDTDEPKPPGPVDLEENVSGTVTVSWAASPDERKMTRTWQIVADHLFNNKYTVINIIQEDKIFSLNYEESKDCSFEAPPQFTVPLKTHRSPESYECYMSCAVTGNPKPHVTWYRNNISLNTNTNYYITNTCGVCSMVILKVSSKDSGDYSVIAENELGRVECSTKLVVDD